MGDLEDRVILDTKDDLGAESHLHIFIKVRSIDLENIYLKNLVKQGHLRTAAFGAFACTKTSYPVAVAFACTKKRVYKHRSLWMHKTKRFNNATDFYHTNKNVLPSIENPFQPIKCLV